MPKINIEVSQTIKDLNMIAKGKAVSTDRIMDLIFNKAEYINVRINGQKLDEEEQKCRQLRKDWSEMIQRQLATAMTD